MAFISGSFAGVLAIVTLFDSEALLNFEISPNGTILFYLGVFGTIFAVSRGMIPDEHLVYEPEPLLRQVLDHIHYFPHEWVGKLHTDEVMCFSPCFNIHMLTRLLGSSTILSAF